MPLRQGDTVRCYTGGGGGYGNPLERDPQAVLTDLADGHITPDYAQRHHRLDARNITEAWPTLPHREVETPTRA